MLLLCVGGGEVARVYGAEQGYPQPRPRPVRRPGCLQQVSCTVCVMFVTLKKDYKYRRKIKGRRCCLGNIIYSIPCRGRCFALGWFWRIWWIHPFSNHLGAIHPILQIVLVQNSYFGKEFIKFCPPNSSNNLCLFFCIYPSSILWSQTIKCGSGSHFFILIRIQILHILKNILF